MNKSISPGAAIALIAVVVVIALVVGYRFISGGPNADITKQTQDFYSKGGAGATGRKPDAVPPAGVPVKQ